MVGASFRKAAVILVAGAGALAAVPGTAGAAASPGPGFAPAQQQLEQQLANRQSQLARLSADVSGAKSLTSAHAAVLNARLATETASIDALATKVPTDTTGAELAADRAAMLRDNRVYAVMTPEVIQTIEADSIGEQVSLLEGESASLQSSVSSLSGKPGYHRALAHFTAFSSLVKAAADNSSDVAGQVLAQTPQGFPGNTGVFVRANRLLLAADVAVAHANYDASLIGLESGGYTGS